MSIRTTFLLPFDSLLAVVQRYIKPECKKGALERLLNRNKVNNLKDLIPEVEGEAVQKKSFKEYSASII
jgi:hypothetical protein